MKKLISFRNQSLTRFTADIFAKYFSNFFCCDKRNFYMHCEQMVYCDYSQVEIVLLKISFRILEYFSNICDVLTPTFL